MPRKAVDAHNSASGIVRAWMRSRSSYRKYIHKMGKRNVVCEERGLSSGPLNTDKEKNLKEKSVSSKEKSGSSSLLEKSKEFFKYIGN